MQNIISFKSISIHAPDFNAAEATIYFPCCKIITGGWNTAFITFKVAAA